MKAAHSQSLHTIVALAVLLLSLSGCREERHEDGHDLDHENAEAPHVDDVTLTSEAVTSNGIRLEEAAKHDLRPTLRVPARIVFNPEGMVHIGSPVKGRISEWAATIGDRVEQGAVLLIVESAELGEAQSDYLVKRTAAQTSAPQQQLARTALERARSLYDTTRGIALTDVEKRETEFVSADSALLSARAVEKAAQQKLALLGMTPEAIADLDRTGNIDPHCAIRAPIAGQVIERAAMLGERVTPEHDALLVLADIGRLYVTADVPEARLLDIVVGARARVLLGVEQEHWCEGNVMFISPALDAATRSVRVRIDVHDRHPELRPGIFARAEIDVPTLDGVGDTIVLAVPESAVYSVEGETVVFVPKYGSKATFAKRVVRVGTTVRGMVPITSGLVPDEEFVAVGGFVLKAAFSSTQVSHAH